jgi:hypothetical protein
MRPTRLLALLTLSLATAPLPGCAVMRHSSQAESVDVEIDNNLLVPTPLTIYVYSSAGARQLLGSVNANRQTTLRFRNGAITGSYRFVAREATQTRGDYLTSPSIELRGGELVTWNLRSNVVLLAR